MWVAGIIHVFFRVFFGCMRGAVDVNRTARIGFRARARGGCVRADGARLASRARARHPGRPRVGDRRASRRPGRWRTDDRTRRYAAAEPPTPSSSTTPGRRRAHARNTLYGLPGPRSASAHWVVAGIRSGHFRFWLSASSFNRVLSVI